MARTLSPRQSGTATIVGYEDDPIDLVRLHYLQTSNGDRYVIPGGRYGIDDPTGLAVRWIGRTIGRSYRWGGETYTVLTSCLLQSTKGTTP